MKLKFISQCIAFLGLSALALFSFQNCSATKFATAPFESASLVGNNASCIKDPITNQCLDLSAVSCQLNDRTIPPQGATTAYRSSTAASGESCISEQRHCVNGSLTGSYQYSTCSVGGPASCLFNGQQIPHGGHVTASQNSSVPSGESCTAQLRQCTNGVLSGSYSFTSCTVGSATMSCHFGGRTYAHGETAPAYLEANVPYGRQCQIQTRQCINGVMTGSYQQTACSQGAAASCQFNGRTLTSGESVPAFQTTSVPYGTQCVSQVRSCYNGVLNGSYNFSSCEPGAPKTCLFAGQSIASGETIKASLSTIVPYNQTCSFQNRKCDNGVLSGDTNYGTLGCIVDSAPPPPPAVVPPTPPPPTCSASEVLSATKSYIKHVAVTESAVVENCKDSANPTYESNDPNTSESAAVRFFNTCGNRYCQQVLKDGYIEGRVIERNAGQVFLECRRKDPPPALSDICQQKLRSLPEPIVIKFPQDTEVATACIDSANPAMADSLPTSAGKSVRFNFTCGTRWCHSIGFSSGRVVENNMGALQVNCYQEEIFNQLDAGVIVTTTNSTIEDISILCEDSSNPLSTDSYPSRNAISQVRFVNTCGNRFCIQKGLGQAGWVTEIQNNMGSEGQRTTSVMCHK